MKKSLFIVKHFSFFSSIVNPICFLCFLNIFSHCRCDVLIIFLSSLVKGWWTGSQHWESRTRETWMRTWLRLMVWRTWSRSAGNSSGLVVNNVWNWMCTLTTAGLRLAWILKAKEMRMCNWLIFRANSNLSCWRCYCWKLSSLAECTNVYSNPTQAFVQKGKIWHAVVLQKSQTHESISTLSSRRALHGIHRK